MVMKKESEVTMEDLAVLIGGGFEQVEKRFKLMEKRMAAFEERQSENGKKLDEHLLNVKKATKKAK